MPMAFRNTLLIISFFILLSASAPIQPRAEKPDGMVGWRSQPKGRGTFNIILSCGITLGLCVWSAIHPNVSGGKTAFERVWHKGNLAFMALLVPEYVVSKSWIQWKEARALHRALIYEAWRKELEKKRRETEEKGPNGGGEQRRVEPVQTTAPSAKTPPPPEGMEHSQIPTADKATVPSAETPPPTEDIEHSQTSTADKVPAHATAKTPPQETGKRGLRVRVKEWVNKKTTDWFNRLLLPLGFGLDECAFPKYVAFFVVMKGFVQEDGKTPVTPIEFFHAFKEGRIDTTERIKLASNDGEDKIPRPVPINPKDIQDKGKASIIAKLITCSQVGWLVLQLVGRQVAGLSMALIELHVLIHILIAAIVYWFWWNKPLDVNEPLILHFEPAQEIKQDWNIRPEELRSQGFRRVVENVWLLPLLDMDHIVLPDPSVPKTEDPLAGSDNIQPTPSPEVKPEVPPAGSSKTQSTSEKEKKGESGCLTLSHKKKKVKTNQSAKTKEIIETIDHENLFACIFYFVYAGLHATAWNTYFSTDMERWAWRGSCLVVGLAPALVFCLLLLFKWIRGLSHDARTLQIAETILDYLLYIIYVLGSLGLLVEAFASLRMLPENAYHTVPWTTFFPHF